MRGACLPFTDSPPPDFGSMAEFIPFGISILSTERDHRIGHQLALVFESMAGGMRFCLTLPARLPAQRRAWHPNIL